MSTVSPFRDSQYTADRDLEKHYHNQAALLLSKVYNVDQEKLKPLVQEVFVPNYNGFKEAKIQVVEKNKYGDRELTVKSARQFFKEVQENNYHLSPSLVAYKHSDEEQSVNSIGTEEFLKARKHFKGKRQEAKAAGDKTAERAFNQIQNALKIFNNAQSGAMSSNGTPLNNKSGHTTLTSTCRVLTSTANICNERLLTGNRLFLNYERTMENFLSLLTATDLPRVQKVMDMLGMAHATTAQVMDMVRRCAHYYWSDRKRMALLEEFVSRLQPIERTVILCVMDLNGLMTTNQKTLTAFLDDWCKVPTIPADAKAEDFPAPANTDYYILAITKLGEKPSKLAINHLNAYHLSVEEKWKDFIEVFMKSRIPPSGIFSIKEMIRESVLTSDTDSSIYTVDNLIDKYTDDLSVALRLNGVLTYFVRMIAVHQHAQFSKNMNVAEKNLYRLNMKNEYLFGSYVTTLMSKHYFATQMMVEGVLNKEVEMEIKGVHLRSSKVALQIKEFAHQLMRDILDAVYEKRKLDAPAILHQVGNLERQIIKDIEEGSPVWLTRATIKDKAVYSNPDSSIYYYHELWESVFADKYGKAPEIPYTAIKINTNTDSKSRFNEYLETIQDPSLRDRLKNFTEGKDKLTTFYLPMEMVGSIGGIPKEMIQGADIRSIIKQNLKSVYAVLETTGIYLLNDNITRLVSDEH